MTTVRKLFDETEVVGRVEELGGEIAALLPRDAAVVGLLKGSFVFVADLARALARRGLTPSIEFLKLSSYRRGNDKLRRGPAAQRSHRRHGRPARIAGG